MYFFLKTLIAYKRCYQLRQPAIILTRKLTIVSPSVPETEYIYAKKWDAVVIGGGHNGLVAAAYIARKKKSVLVLERRHVIGGACVTEEIVPGFKFSRASYLLSLLRPHIIRDLELYKHGLKLYFRNPNSFSPTKNGQYLMLGMDKQQNYQEIAKFSKNDANRFEDYENSLSVITDAIEQILDSPAPNFTDGLKFSMLPQLGSLLAAGRKLGLKQVANFYEIFTSPVSKYLDRRFDCELLKAQLSTDGLIGAMASPHSPGTGYLLLHHVMGNLEGKKNSWAYVEGGMGSVSNALAKSGEEHGAKILTEMSVNKILIDNNKAIGVELENGKKVYTEVVLSNATPHITYNKLLADNISENLKKDVDLIDYTSSVTKINVAVNKLPNFSAKPNLSSGKPDPQHICTIHLNSDTMQQIHEAYEDAYVRQQPSKSPFIEMCIPSTLDPTISPEGCHVVSLFTQYTPYLLADGHWTEEKKEKYCDTVFNAIEEYAPGFKNSVIGKDILTPPDLESIFGLTGGNIFHGSISLDQLYLTRPNKNLVGPQTPFKGVYICGSGTHPGGGVMGSPGYIAAQEVL